MNQFQTLIMKILVYCNLSCVPQYTDKHGEVCPAGWKPGSDTIIPDPKEKMKYFKEHGGEL